MPDKNGIHVHTFHIEGKTDRDVQIKQATIRMLKRNEATVVHKHRDDQRCNEECVIFKPGYEPGSVACELVPLKEN